MKKEECGLFGIYGHPEAARMTYDVFLMEEPLAAAIGAGMDISKPEGIMVMDIGGGTTDIAIIALGGIIASNSVKVAGDKFDESIIKYMRKKHKLYIGERTAEELKINIGTASPRREEVRMICSGRDLVTGLPRDVEITGTEMMEALEESLQQICEATHDVGKDRLGHGGVVRDPAVDR